MIVRENDVVDFGFSMDVNCYIHFNVVVNW